MVLGAQADTPRVFLAEGPSTEMHGKVLETTQPETEGPDSDPSQTYTQQYHPAHESRPPVLSGAATMPKVPEPPGHQTEPSLSGS